ncbi:hypothetical protein [Amycolatopsis sp.]|uniref:hypothetical protein n=1 Tax=Amycolatopsis sp. TaxID=37632 RepID=UPI002BE81C47|nr:hypothetical protein [Amycolatopsis sp.]HVV12097.1 hypothetical protein [Amycolatopsis sp.]
MTVRLLPVDENRNTNILIALAAHGQDGKIRIEWNDTVETGMVRGVRFGLVTYYEEVGGPVTLHAMPAEQVQEFAAEHALTGPDMMILPSYIPMLWRRN